MDQVESFFTKLKRKTKTSTWFLPLTLTSTVIISSLSLFLLFFNGRNPAEIPSLSFEDLGALPTVVPTMKYGFVIDTFQVFEDEIRSGAFLGDILQKQQVPYADVDRLVRNAKDVFDVRHFKAGNRFTILTKDSTQRADYFIYEPNVYEYIVFHLKDSMLVERVKREVVSETKTASGFVQSSLWKTMTSQGLSFELTDKMEDALQWSIDFHHLQKGDEFKLVYDQNYIEGEEVGVGKVYAAYYKNAGKNEYYAIYFENDKDKGYYDLNGKPMKTSFLKAPVKASRISSYYNLNRLHPILKYRRPHYGTDYAAPYGTPIMAIGDGVVLQASYTGGNGNFVKLKHNDNIETQYLHMQKFAEGIRPGVHVKQGQTIGYVGATGLATGPHVCFRFWKNGQQINHLNLNFPPAAPLPDKDLPAFHQIKDQYLKLLKAIEMPANDSTATAEEEAESVPSAEESGHP
ncbi:MAG: peptidoglycan DD-metalloendopeptidase family protein [Saprospiraceae bacterium]